MSQSGFSDGSGQGLDVNVEMLVQSTQNAAIRRSGAEKFHGWLWKRSGRFAKWRNQHFVLEGALLTYYDTFPTDQFVGDSSLTPQSGDKLFACSGESTAKGALRVAHIERSPKSRIAFKIYGVSGKVVDVRAKNEQVCEQWIEQLTQAATLAKRHESLNGSSTSTASSTVSLNLSEPEIEVLTTVLDRNGWLEVGDKKGGGKKRRFCVLQGNLFTVYASEDAWAVPLSRGYIASADVIVSGGCEFEVDTVSGKSRKPLYLRARSEDEMHMWLDTIQNASC